MQIPSDIFVILPWVVKWSVPATRTKLVGKLRIAKGPPYPFVAGPSRRAERRCIGDVGAPYADTERVFSHVAVDGLDQLVVAKKLDTGIGLPFIRPVVRIYGGRLFADLFHCFFQHALIAAFGLHPRAAFFASLVFIHRDNDLEPHLLERFQIAHTLKDGGG